ncbi:hypothetical protein AB0L88_39460 [Saccharopolyspora shandongensis]|uniref:hypothetical protein n=1 Tax=Saccharopolyspora shandongensis TaxID=418495 RepID=UPI00115F97B1|nr:hypothetical protein [Saccharopolyspora shandongensis]
MLAAAATLLASRLWPVDDLDEQEHDHHDRLRSVILASTFEAGLNRSPLLPILVGAAAPWSRGRSGGVAKRGSSGSAVRFHRQ